MAIPCGELQVSFTLKLPSLTMGAVHIEYSEIPNTAHIGILFSHSKSKEAQTFLINIQITIPWYYFWHNWPILDVRIFGKEGTIFEIINGNF